MVVLTVKDIDPTIQNLQRIMACSQTHDKESVLLAIPPPPLCLPPSSSFISFVGFVFALPVSLLLCVFSMRRWGS